MQALPGKARRGKFAPSCCRLMLGGPHLHPCSVWQLQPVMRAVLCVQDAQQAGCTTANGLEMFVGQAVLQYELFTGQPAPVSVMRRVVTEGLP